MKLRNAIQRLTNRYGYEIRKFPAVKYPRYPYFDLALSTLLARAGHDKLWFIQVGANDGNYGDPLRKWIQRPAFQGVVVEPQPNVFVRLQNNYKSLADRIICENSAVSRSPGSLELYRVPVSQDATAQQVWESSIASTNPQVVARQSGLPVSRLEKVAIPCLTLDALIEKHSLPALDLLQIDTEGHDLEVLLSLNLDKTQPKVIQFEHGHLTPAQIRAAVSHLADHRYSVHYGGHESDTVALSSAFLANLA